MNNLINSLKNCILFKGFEEDEIKDILKSINFNLMSFNKGATIALEGDKCLNIGIVIIGNVEIQRLYLSGKVITMTKLSSGNIFGEVIIFSTMNTYPASIVSSDNSQIMFISKKDIIKLCSINTSMLNNFMGLLSNKILMLNRKIKTMSYQTIKQKIANYILEQYSSQKSLLIKLPLSRKEMADYLGIPRPSLSRELINMKNDEIIDFHKNTIKILNLKELEDIFL